MGWKGGVKLNAKEQLNCKGENTHYQMFCPELVLLFTNLLCMHSLCMLSS